MRRILLEHIRLVHPRPEGYYEDVISRGRIDGEVVFIEERDYQELRAKYKGGRIAQVIKPLPYSEWPVWAKALRFMAKRTDKGIGDVIRRTIGEENSDKFKAWFKKTTGKDCGCAGRQSKWNLMYPLKTNEQ